MKHPKIDNNTQRKLMRYLDGEMNSPEAEAFEARLQREPELASRLEELSRVDRLVGRALATSVSLPIRPAGSTSPSRWLAAASIAAAAVICVVLMLPQGSGSGPERAQNPSQAGAQPRVAAVRPEVPSPPSETAGEAPEKFEARFGQIWALYDPQKMEIYIIEKTDRIQVGPRFELTGL